MATLVVHNWHTECGTCRYGSGGWASNRNVHGILTPESKVCINPECQAEFTEVIDAYARAEGLLRD
jgi:hypothetical protein